MKLLLDVWPVIAFFAAYKFAGIYVATAILIAGVLLQVGISWLRHRTVSRMLLTTAAVVLVFGGLTLWLHDATFIKLKPTIVNWLFAAAFGASQLLRGPTIIERMLGENVKMDAVSWRRLNLMWIAFFVVCGAANLYVAYHFDEATWVDFKLFGLIGLTLVFVLIQGVWIANRAEIGDSPRN
jgi:intracellular septation protein